MSTAVSQSLTASWCLRMTLCPWRTVGWMWVRRQGAAVSAPLVPTPTHTTRATAATASCASGTLLPQEVPQWASPSWPSTWVEGLGTGSSSWSPRPVAQPLQVRVEWYSSSSFRLFLKWTHCWWLGIFLWVQYKKSANFWHLSTSKYPKYHKNIKHFFWGGKSAISSFYFQEKTPKRKLLEKSLHF